MAKILIYFTLSLISLTCQASEFSKEIIKHIEGFSSTCKPDNWQISGGYGSGFICKDKNGKSLLSKKISIIAADKQLDKDYTMFRKEVLRHLKYLNKTNAYNIKYFDHEIEALVMLTYQKGWKNMRVQGFVDSLIAYKLRLISESKFQEAFLKLSCYKNSKTKKTYLSLGIFKRNFAILQLFLNQVKTKKDFITFQKKAINYKNLQKSVKFHCKSL